MPVHPSIATTRISQEDFKSLASEVMRHVFDIHKEYGRLFAEPVNKRELAADSHSRWGTQRGSARVGVRTIRSRCATTRTAQGIRCWSQRWIASLNPMSRPAFGDSIHLNVRIRFRSSRKSFQKMPTDTDHTPASWRLAEFDNRLDLVQVAGSEDDAKAEVAATGGFAVAVAVGRAACLGAVQPGSTSRDPE
jgi:hypothetical protein